MSKVGYINNQVSNKPTVIVPDIHGRPLFVSQVFDNYPTDVWDIVFLGDILHTEGTQKRWLDIEREFLRSNLFGEEMAKEINASFDALKLILEKQENCPDSVFLLRGNHDDIKGSFVGPYGKYTRTGGSSLFYYGLKQLRFDLYADYDVYEKTIPYLYIGRDFLCSHSVPTDVFTLDEVILNNRTTHVNFTWTDNVSQQGKWTRNFSKNCTNLGPENMNYWFIGHRPCDPDKLVRKQMNGRLIQCNHPKRHVVLELQPDCPFKAVVL